MISEVTVEGKKIKLDPSKALGKGGEADVYDIRGVIPNMVLKIFKTPDHPDLAGNQHEQHAAQERIMTHQRKLKEFPQELPDRVIAPKHLALDRNGNVAGYAMLFQQGTELRSYSKIDFRKAVPNTDVMEIFIDLHGTVHGLHEKKVIIGDFNDLNVLVAGKAAFVVDADSMQFAQFLSKVFTGQLVDPTKCDPNDKTVLLNQPHDANSDWYAFGVMLFQSLLFVDPYGGVYRPKKGGTMVPPPQRPMKRITVFN